ncbi:hypothetical protein HDK90DRAFT_506938 [Phyllosticta capitalensis]|uniref:Uncharacterized protein n=1 Tax=Phyllosticta capitalensis TaxID=121624 RepID=A0ABR1Z4C8_9PEZI
MHLDLRPALILEESEESTCTVEHCCSALTRILAEWSRRNRELSREIATVKIDALLTTACDDSDETLRDILHFKSQVQSLPTINGSAMNLATVVGLCQYFAQDIDFFFTPAVTNPDDLEYLSALAKRIRVCLLELRGSFCEAQMTAKLLDDDTIPVWKQFSKPQDPHAREDAQVSASKREKFKNRLKAMIGISGAASHHGTHASDQSSEGCPSRKSSRKKNDPNNICISHPFDARHVLGLSGSNSCSRLDALPEASLPQLELSQVDFNQHLERSRRFPQNGKPLEYSHGKDRSLQEEKHDSVISDEQAIDEDQDRIETSSFESEYPRTMIAVESGHTDADEDPEVSKMWWRQRALEDLERGCDQDVAP